MSAATLDRTKTANDTLAGLDATAQAALVRSGAVSPPELVEAAIARIEAVNPALNAVTHKLYDLARARAAEPVGEGAFAGVPFLIKDLLPVAGVPNTSSCRALAGAIGQISPPHVEAFAAAGLFPLRPTNTPAPRPLDHTQPTLYGPTHNPWDPTRSPAGSPGASGAAGMARPTPPGPPRAAGGAL